MSSRDMLGRVVIGTLTATALAAAPAYADDPPAPAPTTTDAAPTTPPAAATPSPGQATPPPAPSVPTPPPTPSTPTSPTAAPQVMGPIGQRAQPITGAKVKPPTRPAAKPKPTGTDTEDDDRTAADEDPATAKADAAPDPTAAGLQGDPLALRTLDVPNVLLRNFRIPPFLLSIYQAAGIQYGVRWEVLAAINEIETDYGRNLNVSTAGAEGWMQFMPATWAQYGVDANRDGRRDPYNPVDAIFAAARYLKAAGAGDDLRRAIFAYNHADWYVDSVLLRAKLIAGLPAPFVAALTGLTQGRFPVHATATYDRDEATEGKPRRRVVIAARAGAPVIAVQDARVVSFGVDRRLGRYLRLRDAFGNTYTYGGLGEVARSYRLAGPLGDEGAAPRRQRTKEAGNLIAMARGVRTRAHAPSGTAGGGDTRGTQSGLIAPAVRVAPDRATLRAAAAAIVSRRSEIPAGGGAPAPGAAPAGLGEATGVALATPLLHGSAASPFSPLALAPASQSAQPAVPAEATPALPAEVVPPASTPAAAVAPVSQPAEGTRPTPAAAEPAPAAAAEPAPESPNAETRPTVRYRPSQPVTGAAADGAQRTLRRGALVPSGTVVGRLGENPDGISHLTFEIRPAGKGSPRIDPVPLLDGWRLLETTALYRASSGSGLADGRRAAGAGQVLLLSKATLQRRILSDPRVRLYPCGRRDIAAGTVDRRVLAALEFLAASGLQPTVSSLRCGHGYLTSSGNVSEHSSGNAVDIAAINGVPIAGHQGVGSVTEAAVRRLMALQGAMRPHQIISLMTFPGADNTLALPDHDDHIHLGFAPQAGDDSVLGAQTAEILSPGDWTTLANRLSVLAQPKVVTTPSDAALPVAADKR